MRVAIVAPSLDRDGGTQRISAALANALAEAAHDVLVVTRYQATFDRLSTDDGIVVRSMFVPSGPKILKNVQLPLVVSSLRRHLRTFAPDVVIGSRWDCAILALLATKGGSAPVVVWEHGYLPKASLTAAWRLLRHRTYPRSAALVVINEGSRAFAEQLVRRDRVHVIPNFIVAPPVAASIREPSAWTSVPGSRPGKRLVALGRLEHEKGFDLLVRAYARIAKDVEDWRMLIVGRGSQRSALESLIATHRLEGTVHIGGPVSHPAETLRDSDAFALSSRHEGFGLGLIEAMAAGLPVVAYACPGGPREIVRDEVDGLLVPDGDVAALGAALLRLLGDAALRARLAQRAPEVRERFSQQRALAAWTTVLRSAIEPTPAADDAADRSG